MSGIGTRFAMAVLLVSTGCGPEIPPPRLITTGDLYRAKALVLPKRTEEFGRDVLGRTWVLSGEDGSGFTSFSDGVGGLRTTRDGGMAFRLDSTHVALEWGNADGQMPFENRVHLWSESLNIGLQARQLLGDGSHWAMQLLRDGWAERRRRPAQRERLAGSEWQNLTFPGGPGSMLAAAARPDGFRLTIEGTVGDEIEIRDLQITREVHEEWLRKEFELPEGEIWRAAATVGNQVVLTVNGREVPSTTSVFPRPVYDGFMMYGTKSVDLKPYLQAGTNCVGIHGFRIGYPPYLYLQSQIVMASGEVVRVDSDETWRWSPEEAAGWCDPGFDDREWQPVTGQENWADPSENALAITSWNLFYKKPSDRPAYDGVVVLENPQESRLFYRDVKPVILRARAPGGLAGRRPELAWSIRRFDDGYGDVVASGRENSASASGSSLAWELNAGRLARGVYTVHCTLSGNQGVIEQPIAEPLVVVGKLPMRTASGRAYEEGMELVLEDSIDFTDPNDPHPWLETDGSNTPPRGTQTPPPVAQQITEPSIVERGGLKYRETQTGRGIRGVEGNVGAQFSYKVAFDHPGDFYLMVLDYPDDRERWIGVSCTAAWHGLTSYSKSGHAVWTGIKQPVTGTMKQMKWIYRADPGAHAVNVMSLRRNVPAAAAGLRVYHIANGLPELAAPDPNGRHIGILTENLWSENSFGRTFRCATEPYIEDRDARRRATRASADKDPVYHACRNLQEWLDTSEHYARYLRFTGQNLHVIGCYQYGDGNHALPAPEGIGTSRIPDDMKDLAVRVLGENGIDVLANIEFSYNSGLLRSPEAQANDGQVRRGADTVYLVDKTGRQMRAWDGRYGWNFLHPKVEAAMLRVAEDVARKFRSQPSFRGITWTPYYGGDWLPGYRSGYHNRRDPLAASYDDVTVALFERDTGITVPGDRGDPDRFGKRYAFLMSAKLKDLWIQWRCEKIRAFFGKVVDRIGRERDGLGCLVVPKFYVPHDREWKASSLPLRDYMRLSGWDPSLYHDRDHLWMVHYTHATLKYEPAFGRKGYAVGWEQSVNPEFYELYGADTRRAAMVLHHWIEVERVAFTLPEREGWPRSFQSTMQAQASGPNAREPFIQALIGGDPELFLFGFSHVSLMVGDEQPLRDFARVLRSLPRRKFSPVMDTGLQTNLAIRDLEGDGAYTFYVANPGYWPIRGTVALENGGAVVDLTTGGRIDARLEGEMTVVPVALEPYGISAYRVDDARAKVVSWGTNPVAKDDLTHMREILDRAESLLTDPRVVKALPEGDRKLVRDSIESARADLADGQYARAWSTITHWRFWTLVRQEMERAAAVSPQ